MKKADQESFRQTLQALRARLTGDVSELTGQALRKTGGEASGNLSNAPLHMADLGTDNFEQEMSMTLLANEKQILDEIQHALDRIGEGGYGTCEECGREISLERLKALPYTRHCIDCSRRLQSAGQDGMKRATL